MIFVATIYRYSYCSKNEHYPGNYNIQIRTIIFYGDIEHMEIGAKLKLACVRDKKLISHNLRFTVSERRQPQRHMQINRKFINNNGMSLMKRSVEFANLIIP